MRPRQGPFPRYHIGHFLGRPETPLDIALFRIEDLEDPDIEDPHLHTFHEILWFESGESTQVIDYRAFGIQPDTLFFIQPGQAHHFEAYHHLRGWCLMFTEHFLVGNGNGPAALFPLHFLDRFQADPLLPTDAAARGELLPLVGLLNDEYRRPNPSVDALRALLHVLLLRMGRLANARPAAPEVRLHHWQVFRSFKDLMEEHLHTPMGVADYAHALFMTPDALNMAVKRASGQTAGEALRTRKTLEAKRLLAHTALPVADVADRLGFADPSYFARFFHRESGVSPAAFRKTASEKYPNTLLSS